MNRRHVQVILGLLWILDGALQLQPFMFGRGFARDVIAPAGDGQPAWVSSAVHWAANTIASAPVTWDLPFAAIQLGIGVALLFPRTVKPALAVSLGWSAGVWFLGEGLGGLTSGHADLLTGAPGAVMLYGVLALAVWPGSGKANGVDTARAAAWLPLAWAVVWVGGAGFRLLPGQNQVGEVAAEIRGNADGAPSWLAQVDHSVAAALNGTGQWVLFGLVALQALIGLLAISTGALRTVAGVLGIALSAVFWVVGQSLGELWTGQATDPNTAPLLILMALAMMASPAVALSSASAAPRADPGSKALHERPARSGLR